MAIPTIARSNVGDDSPARYMSRAGEKGSVAVFTIGQRVQVPSGFGAYCTGAIVKIGRVTKIASDRKYLVRLGTGEYWRRAYEISALKEG